MGLKSAVNGVVAKVATKVGIAWALSQVRAAAEGKYGPVWQRRYQLASAAAPITGLVLMAITVGLADQGMVDQVREVGTVAAVLLAAGLLNAAYLDTIPDVVKTSRVYQWLAAHAPLTTALMGTAWLALEACGDPRCAHWKVGVAVAGAIAAKLSLVDPLWKTQRPDLQGAVLGEIRIAIVGNAEQAAEAIKQSLRKEKA